MVTPSHQLVESSNLEFSAQAVQQIDILASGTRKYRKGQFVWVANRDRPLMNTSGVVLIDGNGITILQRANSTDGIVWRANTSRYMKNPVSSGNYDKEDRNCGMKHCFLHIKGNVTSGAIYYNNSESSLADERSPGCTYRMKHLRESCEQLDEPVILQKKRNMLIE
ncbi:hypothetical protein POM88_006269 [Heracleum sosnowskyi]|uniref:Bulb-type lectin domain-containing protein n=1 Tax=Heracleum sosnowskyi TaxID=360622 RepID=A0AAD8N591_9APIA|nr:hypothetical protein POM88_006269 [Heracleum sosnowskyi]